MQGRKAGPKAYVVALRKESVDRNSDNRRSRLALDVALRKESVDRNMRTTLIFLLSP